MDLKIALWFTRINKVLD